MVLLCCMETAPFDWKNYLDKCLESTNFCSLATTDGKETWSNPVYFAWDEKYNIYFISQPTSRHMKNIEDNGVVSVSVYSTNQVPGEDVFGIQLKGTAKILTDIEEVKEAYAVYYKRRFPETGIDANKSPEDCAKEDAEWKLVKIAHDELCYFDTRFFDEERQVAPF